jgi:hypothetical protein
LAGEDLTSGVQNQYRDRLLPGDNVLL